MAGTAAYPGHRPSVARVVTTFSWDPEVEMLFNEQKNDVGISVDAAELDATAGQLERGGGQFCDEMGVTSLFEPRTLSSAIDQ